MVAFEAARRLGCGAFETDLRITADGVLVCFHDSTVDRTTNGSGPVAEMTYAEIAVLDAGYRHRRAGSFPYRGQGIRVPRLEELVSAHPDVHLVVDLKADGTELPLAEEINRLGLRDRLLVGSFSDRRLQTFRRLTGGTVPTSTGERETMLVWMAAQAGTGIAIEAAALQIPITWFGVPLVTERMIAAAHRSSLLVQVWTINRRVEMEGMLGLRVDGIITDRPDVLSQVLAG